MLEEIAKDGNEIKELFDENGTYKEVATLYEIAQCWSHNSPHELLDVTRNLLVRCREGNYKFQNPKELYVQLDDEILIGKKSRASSLDLQSIIYGLEKAVKELCKHSISDDKPIPDIDYDSMFNCFYKLDLDFDGFTKHGFCFQLASELASYVRNLITPPLKEIINPTMNQLVDDLRFTQENKKFNAVFLKEKEAMFLAISKHISIERETFLHWLRLKLNTEKGSIDFDKRQSFIPLEYNGFWGDEWEEQPKVWNSEVDGSEGLILKEAYRYYADFDTIAEYENTVEQIGKLEAEYKTKTNADKLENDLELNNERLQLINVNIQNNFLAHFHPNNNRLYATGYFDKKEPEAITYSQLKDMFEGNQINIDSSCGTIGQVNVISIRVFKKGIFADGYSDWQEEYHKLKDKYENSYSTIYLDAMREAIVYFNISEDYQPMKRHLVEWFEREIPDISENLAKAMATMVRLPEMQKGGFYKGNKKKG